MQIQRPFYLYALPPLAVKPSALGEDDRRCLTVLTSWQIKALAGVTAGFSLWLLARVYDRLPQILPVMEPRAGLVCAIASFFFACLFLQISVSVLRSLFIGQDTLQRVKPFEPSEIASSFLIPGWRVNKILPTVATVTDSSRSKPIAKPSKSSNNEDLVPTEQSQQPPEQSTAPKAEEISVDTDSAGVKRAELKTANSVGLEPQSDAEETATPSVEEQITEAEKSTKVGAPAANPILEDPPLVIPEIIESDDFEANGDR